MVGQACHQGTSQDDTAWVARDTKYSRIGELRLASHQGTSQDGTGHPGILSIQGLGWSGRPAIRGHPRMVLGILGYLVFKDWGVTAGQPSGHIPGWQ